MQKLITLVITIIAMTACKQISPICENTEYTYNDDVKYIIDANCNTSGCHTQGANIGDFTSYSKMEKYLKNGKFNRHVFIKKDMPKGFELNAEDKTVLQCWKEKGYLEN